jgi:phage terminase Nu1 subunit (DNA packaging protein)
MKVALPKLAKLIGETVEALEGLQGSILTDGAEVELEVSVLAYCNWLRAGGKVRQSVEVEIRNEQLAKLKAERAIVEAKADKIGLTLPKAAEMLAAGMNLGQACLFLGPKEDTLKKWFGKGCPVDRPGGEYVIRLADVFDWRLKHERALLMTPAEAGNGGAMHLEAERAMLARSQREAVEMANAVRRGELVEAAGVLREWQTLIAACRAKLLSLGDKLAARLPIPDAVRKKVAAAIRDGIAEALKELADDRA